LRRSGAAVGRSTDDRLTKARVLVRYRSHSFRPLELRTAEPASDAIIAEVLDVVEEVLGG